MAARTSVGVDATQPGGFGKGGSDFGLAQATGTSCRAADEQYLHGGGMRLLDVVFHQRAEGQVEDHGCAIGVK